MQHKDILKMTIGTQQIEINNMTITNIYNPAGKLIYSFGGDWIYSWSTIVEWCLGEWGSEPDLLETDEGDMVMVNGIIVGRIG